MKKLLLIILIMIVSSLSAYTLPKEKERESKKKNESKKETPVVETKPVFDENKLKQDIQSTVLEFINDLKINPDSCYIPFKEIKK